MEGEIRGAAWQGLVDTAQKNALDIKTLCSTLIFDDKKGPAAAGPIAVGMVYRRPISL